ncbi:hypothetical protein [Armatimonas sp.]|uniref:hypothetical protein n=1 Tax=Armatimonas sp. TaxID=1872638 RepID=UPI0037537294
MHRGSDTIPYVSHPGILNTKKDLERLRTQLNVEHGSEPWRSGFIKLKEHLTSSAQGRVRGGFPTVCRETAKNLGNDELASDANAAYQNALMWWLTGEKAHKEKAIAALDAWGGVSGRPSWLWYRIILEGKFGKISLCASLWRHSR